MKQVSQSRLHSNTNRTFHMRTAVHRAVEATDSCPTQMKTYHQGMAIGQELGWKGFAKLIARMI